MQSTLHEHMNSVALEVAMADIFSIVIILTFWRILSNMHSTAKMPWDSRASMWAKEMCMLINSLPVGTGFRENWALQWQRWKIQWNPKQIQVKSGGSVYVSPDETSFLLKLLMLLYDKCCIISNNNYEKQTFYKKGNVLNFISPNDNAVLNKVLVFNLHVAKNHKLCRYSEVILPI